MNRCAEILESRTVWNAVCTFLACFLKPPTGIGCTLMTWAFAFMHGVKSLEDAYNTLGFKRPVHHVPQLAAFALVLAGLLWRAGTFFLGVLMLPLRSFDN